MASSDFGSRLCRLTALPGAGSFKPIARTKFSDNDPAVKFGYHISAKREPKLKSSSLPSTKHFPKLVISFMVGATFCLPSFCSDWEEDKKPQDYQLPRDTVILDGESTSKTQKESGGESGTVLKGSATAIRTKPNFQSSSAQAAARSAHLMEVARIDQDANRFLQQAEVNVVTPPTVFRSWLETTHPSLSAKFSPEELVVVRGQWDDSTKPLHSFGLRFRPIKTKELRDFDFEKCKIMIIDCAGVVPKETLQKIRDFVLKGGFLVSTDWTLQNVLERAFPNFVQWNRDNTDGSITDAYVLEPENSLLAGIPGRRFTWKLDRLSQCLRIMNPSKVSILARSSLLAARDPQLRVIDPMQAGALAIEFSFGRGKVLHLVGHFDNCANSFKPNLLPDPAPNIGISLRQAITANFIAEALGSNKEKDQK
jgi:hypothetical protein